MGVFLGLVGTLGIMVGLVMLITAFVRKKPRKKAGIITGVSFALLFLGAALTPTVEETKEEETAPTEVADKAKEQKKVSEEERVQAEKEAKEKQEADKKAQDEKAAKEKAEKAEKAAKKLAEEKEYYMNEVKSKVDTQMQMYDDAWSTIWQPTFEGIGNGSVDVYTAYDNMKAVEQRYQTLQNSLPAIPDKGLSKENKKQLSTFKSKMANASMWRAEAADKAKKMFDEGDFSPSQLDKVKADVEKADSEMLTAIFSLTTLETTLGIERE